MAHPISIDCEQPHEMAAEIRAAAGWLGDQLRKLSQSNQEKCQGESEEQIQAFQLALEEDLAKKILDFNFTDYQITPNDLSIQKAANIVEINSDFNIIETIYITRGCVIVGSPYWCHNRPKKMIYISFVNGWRRLLLSIFYRSFHVLSSLLISVFYLVTIVFVATIGKIRDCTQKIGAEESKT